MSLELCVLASGSSGNCALLRSPAGVVMIDAGLGPRVLRQRLVGTGVELGDIAAVLLTHLDTDHFNANLIPHLAQRGIRVFVHHTKAPELAERAEDEDDEFARLIRPFDDAFVVTNDLHVLARRMAHDREGSHAFRVGCEGVEVGYATDLGRVPAGLVEWLAGVEILAIEANYDPAMQRASGRPMFLQQRIMGGAGHLSNEQALAAVKKIFDRAQRTPSHVVLLHRSRQCNCPKLLQRLFETDARIAARLTLAHQYEATGWLRAHGEPAQGEQLKLGFA